MTVPVKISSLRRRFLKTAVKIYPPLAGLLWGGFWMPSILSLENVFQETALILAAFAFGLLFRHRPGTVFSKLLSWCCGCVAFLNYGLLYPAAFFYGMMDLPGRRGRYTGTFAVGFIIGALVGAVFELAPAALLLSGVLYFLFNRRRKIKNLRQRLLACGLFGVIALECAWFIFGLLPVVAPDVPAEAAGMSRLTRICCFGLSKKTAPEVLFVSRLITEPETAFEYKLLSDAYLVSPGKPIDKKYDLVVIEHLSSAMFSAPGKLPAALKENGILVVPERFCHLLPELLWRTLPVGAGGERYVAAMPDSKLPLMISPTQLDENLSRYFASDEEGESGILPGAIAGVLTGFKSKPVYFTVPPVKKTALPDWLWAGVLFFVLIEICLHNTRVAEYFYSASSAFIFGVICGSLMNAGFDFYGGSWLCFLLASLALWLELPFKSSVLRIFSAISVITLLLYGWTQAHLAAHLALLFSGVTYAGVKSRYRGKSLNAGNFEMVCVLGFAAGFFICGMISEPRFALFAALCSLKLYLQLRS